MEMLSKEHSIGELAGTFEEKIPVARKTLVGLKVKRHAEFRRRWLQTGPDRLDRENPVFAADPGLGRRSIELSGRCSN